MPERFTPPTGLRQRRSLLAGISVLTQTRGLVPLIVVMLMAQFATQAVQPVVTVGGIPSPNVTFSGLTPGFVGLYQVNAECAGRAHDPEAKS